jgi:peptide/nickel transport system permease protein
MLGVSFLVFVFLRLLPGDPALTMAGQDATLEQLEQIREELGLTKPIPIQFLIWLQHILQGDFGNSIVTGKPNLPLLLERFAATLHIAILATILAAVLGVAAGILAAVRPYSILDNLVAVSSLLGVSVPSFWLGILLILLFGVQLNWFPSGGSGTWKHVVLPTISLGLFSVGIIARMTRATMLEVMTHDYIRTARSKGLQMPRVLLRHALRNALIPILTVIGLQFGYLLAGAVVTETVFNYPGLGRLMLLSIQSRDYTIVQGSVLIVAACFVSVNMLVEFLYVVIDPRLR